jgi:hypothetical protein
MRKALILAALLASLAAPALAQPGSQHDPIVVRMKRGAATVVLTGVLRRNRDCCAYRFKASAGQLLKWKLAGPATRQTIAYPDGHTDGPGLPNPLPLPADGAYLFSVRPNLMADGAFGRFRLQLTIPPRR